jgi:hypothetical protein
MAAREEKEMGQPSGWLLVDKFMSRLIKCTRNWMLNQFFCILEELEVLI